MVKFTKIRLIWAISSFSIVVLLIFLAINYFIKDVHTTLLADRTTENIYFTFLGISNILGIISGWGNLWIINDKNNGKTEKFFSFLLFFLFIITLITYWYEILHWI